MSYDRGDTMIAGVDMHMMLNGTSLNCAEAPASPCSDLQRGRRNHTSAERLRVVHNVPGVGGQQWRSASSRSLCEQPRRRLFAGQRCANAARKGLPRRSCACPVALRGVLKGEGASATTAPKCTKVACRSVTTSPSMVTTSCLSSRRLANPARASVCRVKIRT